MQDQEKIAEINNELQKAISEIFMFEQCSNAQERADRVAKAVMHINIARLRSIELHNGGLYKMDELVKACQMG